MKHYHYEICGFNEKVPYPESSNLPKTEYQMADSCKILAISQNEQAALREAEKMVTKKHYRIMVVGECHEAEMDHSLTVELDQELKLAQLQMIKKNKL